MCFHYDVDSSGSVAEAAHLCSRGIKVNVLVSNSNAHTLKEAYGKIPGATENLTVRPLLLRSRDLSVERMNKLMAFSDKGGTVPLYMEVIQRILRKMAVEHHGQHFDYSAFKRQLALENLDARSQTGPMNLRLALLESFLLPSSIKGKKGSGSTVVDPIPGTLTVIDLSDPFVDAPTVCVLFDICLSLIKERRPECGLVIALDEAHKYMDSSTAATNFTARLLTTIREQRHNATRVYIATQEPTISEKLLDLCSVSIVHRFSSPSWFHAIKDHLGGASSMTTTAEEQNVMFQRIVSLQVGENLVFSPSSYVRMEDGRPKKLASGVMNMKTRI